ncbi:hypothetical protein CEXT_33691 [Caerostris extrusa]|uniref:Uncharacterized protein n=1 Tax=Caerostris extrusa TaxID=172846 RepID=A0AAV4PTN2_CAEEX|nr:hypothetical protein CEXT_33691 [Caerostris extrusa]
MEGVYSYADNSPVPACHQCWFRHCADLLLLHFFLRLLCRKEEERKDREKPEEDTEDKNERTIEDPRDIIMKILRNFECSTEDIARG